MNIEAYDLDFLRELVRELQKENRSLRELLAERQIPCDVPSAFDPGNPPPDEYDPDQASRIAQFPVNDSVARQYYGMFWGRTDMFARRGKHGGYFPQCENRWEASLCPKQQGEKQACDACENKKWDTSDAGADRAASARKKRRLRGCDRGLPAFSRRYLPFPGV